MKHSEPTPRCGIRDTSGDWPEDFSLENGNYLCHCLDCERSFMGYKRRVACKVCALPPAPAASGEPSDEARGAEALESWLEELENEGAQAEVAAARIREFVAALRAEVEAGRRDTARLQLIGDLLANCAFNLAQCDRLTTDERDVLDKLRKQWDRALSTPTSGAIP